MELASGCLGLISGILLAPVLHTSTVPVPKYRAHAQLKFRHAIEVQLHHMYCSLEVCFSRPASSGKGTRFGLHQATLVNAVLSLQPWGCDLLFLLPLLDLLCSRRLGSRLFCFLRASQNTPKPCASYMQKANSLESHDILGQQISTSMATRGLKGKVYIDMKCDEPAPAFPPA